MSSIKSRRRTWQRSVVATAAGLCLAGAVFAAETGGLRIAVTGASGKPVAGATVKISSPSSLVSKTAVTDADGTVRVTGLDPATNYKVEVIAAGYSSFSASNVAVVSGQNVSVGYALGSAAATTVVVTGSRLAVIDTTSAVVSTTLNLDIVESLPTTRSYQGYLQLVPGVKPSTTGNPSSKSGINYSDAGNQTGQSSDNVYMLDGVNVTDNETGTFGANFNSEIIQEQQVLTGGVPAEYPGGAGLVSRVTTKSGSNEWHGSVNYYFQNDSLVSKNKHKTSSGFSTYDTALTLGGPIIKDKLWFFGSYQRKHRADDVLDPNTGNALRKVNTDQDLGFFKATWQITEQDRLTALFFNDPYERDGSTDFTILNNRDSVRKQGGDNYKIEYSRDWDNLRLNVYGFSHKAQLATEAKLNASRNDIITLDPAATNADLQLGGQGAKNDIWRNNEEFGLSAEYFLDSSFGSHTIKGGFSATTNKRIANNTITGDRAQYVSLALANQNTTYADVIGLTWQGEAQLSDADSAEILTAINANATVRALLDTNSSGAVDDAELGAYRFNSVAGNPNGQVNSYRYFEESAAPYTVKSTGKTMYLQDTWTLDQWTVNAGVRAEEWIHFDSKGDRAGKFKWEFAPRLSVVYDLAGNGRSKVWGFYGRYYDPIRTDMSNFAGTLTGPLRHEQIHIGNEWVTYRTRGGAQVQDAFIAPATKTPYTDEFMLGWSTTFQRDYNVQVTYTARQSRDLLEDYALTLYSNPTNPSAAQPNANSKYYLPYSYFGYDGLPSSNFVIGTLAGGKRDYKGLEISLTRQKRDNWQGGASDAYNDQKGNSNSDGNADYQGDVIWLDPRAPNMWGPTPGNIKHQFKAFGTYYFESGFEASGVFNWNSGLVYSKMQDLGGRGVPLRGPSSDPASTYEDGGVRTRWVAPGMVGGFTAPSYYTLDARLKYTHPLSFGKVELFLDIFNVLNRQSATEEMNLSPGDGVYNFGEANMWVEPRRYYLGVRYSF